MADQTEIDATISAREGQIERLRRELEIAEAELRGMKLLRDFLMKKADTVIYPPLHAAAPMPRPSNGARGYRGGRQPGAISTIWRHILSDLYWHDGVPGLPFSIDALVITARARGINLRPSEAAARLSHYQTFNYVSGVDREGRCAITRVAADKFGFAQSPLKDEAPNAEAPGPHESVEVADQIGAVEPPEKGKGLYD